MGRFIHSKYLRETPFFEISGLPGRLYLESFAFGDESLDHSNLGFNLQSEESPLTLLPDPKKEGTSILLRTLDQSRSNSNVYNVVEKIGACSIGAEFKGSDRIITTTIYLFFECDLTRLRLFGANHKFQIEFKQIHRVGGFVTRRSW